MTLLPSNPDKTSLPAENTALAAGVCLLDAVKLTLPQAAKRIGVSETKLRLIIQHGEIPVLRLGGKTLIIEQDIGNYLQGNYGRMVVSARKPKGRPSLPKSILESEMLNKAS